MRPPTTRSATRNNPKPNSEDKSTKPRKNSRVKTNPVPITAPGKSKSGPTSKDTFRESWVKKLRTTNSGSKLRDPF